MDERVSEGVAVNGAAGAGHQTGSKRCRQGCPAEDRSRARQVLALNKQAREIKLSGDIEAMRDFIRLQYLGAIGRYVDSLQDFVKLQEQQRDAASLQLQQDQQKRSGCPGWCRPWC
jgi:hypothetical protein